MVRINDISTKLGVADKIVRKTFGLGDSNMSLPLLLRLFFFFALMRLMPGILTFPSVAATTLSPLNGITTRDSVASDGEEGNNASLLSAISEDGRYVAFRSDATNLVAGDTNNVVDIFVYDYQTTQITRVSVASDGTQGNGASQRVAISSDGRYVAFQSDATNLVVNDTNNQGDIFRHDLQTRQTIRISVASDGTQGNGASIEPAISADGQYIAFRSDATNMVTGDSNGVQDVFVHDRNGGQTTRVSVASDGTQGNDVAGDPSISLDGQYVAFHSVATNLVVNDTNAKVDIFVHDRQNGQTTRVSVASAGTQANDNSNIASISADGRYVAFQSTATNLVGSDTNGATDIFVHDRQTGQTSRVSVGAGGVQAAGSSLYAAISADGQLVVFDSDANNLIGEDDTNGVRDVFVRNRQTGTTVRVSMNSTGIQGNNNSQIAAISGDGQYVAFQSIATALVGNDTNNVEDVFRHDRQTGETTRVSQTGDGVEGNSTSRSPSVSADGRYVAFESNATNLVPNDSNNVYDIFVRDRQTGQTNLVSVDSDGTQGNNNSQLPFISSDGRYVTFQSAATNLIANDTNGRTDIFIHDRVKGETSLVSVASNGTQGDNVSVFASVSDDGRFVAFRSAATNLVANDTNGVEDIFVHDRQNGQTIRVSVASDGTQGDDLSVNPFISADGRYVAFFSNATNLVPNDTNGFYDIFVHDRQNGQTTRVSVASDGTQALNGNSSTARISPDGRYVVFHSAANNLVGSDTNNITDIFVHDRQTGQTQRVSVSSTGVEGNGISLRASISADGRYVAFDSVASNLADTEDTNGVDDVFVRDREKGVTIRVSIATDGTQGNNQSYPSVISRDGRYITFASTATNLIVSDTNGFSDVFIHDRGNPTPPTPTATPTGTITQTPTATRSVTPSPTPPPGATFTPTPTKTNTPPPGATLTSTPTKTNTPPPGATLTPTLDPTVPPSDGAVFIPLVLRQYAFATPAPTPTPVPTVTSVPTCMNVDQEPNDFFLNADTYLPLCGGVAFSGLLSATDLNDIYRVELSGAGTIRFDLTGIPNGSNFDLYLYDYLRQPIANSTQAGAVNESIVTPLSAGRYYVRVVFGQLSAPGSYQLQWRPE
jgi:Tol biopolymer transport system component